MWTFVRFIIFWKKNVDTWELLNIVDTYKLVCVYVEIYKCLCDYVLRVINFLVEIERHVIHAELMCVLFMVLYVWIVWLNYVCVCLRCLCALCV